MLMTERDKKREQLTQEFEATRTAKNELKFQQRTEASNKLARRSITPCVGNPKLRQSIETVKVQGVLLKDK